MTDSNAVIRSELLAQAAQLLADAQHILILTGAGISAESGIPTFREAQTGLWARFSPQDLATPEAFAADPIRIWAWYQWRRRLIAEGGINPGHQALATLARLRDVTLATQNVDGLHGAAGQPDIAELHGNIWRDRCPACGHAATHPVALPNTETPTYCAKCGTMARPDVVWFGEMLPETALERAYQGLTRADCVLVVGTSNRVYPAAALVDSAVQSTVPVIEINPEPTHVSAQVDVRLAATASVALPAIVDRLRGLLDAVAANR